MRILIFGANSFIGRNFIYYLKEKKDVYVELYDYQDIQFDNVKGYCRFNPLDKNEWKRLDLNCDLIYFFVGMTGTEKSIVNYDGFIDVNEKSLLHLLTECKEQASKAKIVFPSSRLIYKGKKTPIKENDEKEAKTIYATNKLSCENYLKLFNNIFGINYCTLRICVPFGSLINNVSSYGTAEFFVNKAASGQDLTLYGSGEIKRTFTYIGDLCEILWAVGINNNCLNDAYNVGGCTLSLKRLAEMVSQKYKVKTVTIDYPDFAKKIESGDTVFDSSKLDFIINQTEYYSILDWLNSTK